MFGKLFRKILVPRKHFLNTTQHYGGWGTYSLPRHPIELITQEEAETRHVYYVGTYDGDANLVKFERHINGALDWTDEYTYWETGVLKSRLMIKSDGTTLQQNFNHDGRLDET